ncbi:MAG: alanine racemase [Desulfamplus sp.]|nr:alanine racemase [Desulfamplus sp.]
MNDNLIPQSRLYVNLDALARNIKALKAKCDPDVSLMAVVKANAYGHGAVSVSRTALENGASFLAVARIHEAVELRQAGIDAPLLLFGDALPSQVEWLAQHDVRVTIGSVDVARELADAACHCGGTLKVHLKIDTGMGRLGFVVPEMVSLISCERHDRAFDTAIDEIMGISTLDGLHVEGIYTHFANSDIRDKSHARGQVALFNRLICNLAKRGFKPEICHSANSAAIMEMPEGHFNMVRAGIAMYGLWPSDEINRDLIHIEPVMSVVSKIIHLKAVPSGFKVSYGSTHVTPLPTKIATVPIGYADGYNRLLSSKGDMLVRGIRCPVVGRVCMDYTMIDVGSVPDAKLGDDVVVMGRQGDHFISADEIARHINTINYEVVCSFNRRMPIVNHPL